MIADLKPYPVMKDSGVEWLGEVPESWEVRRNGRLFAQRNETGFADLCILEVSLRTGVRVRDFENSGRKQVMSDRDKYKRALAGDIAYNMMRMWQGAVGVAPVDGLISPAYVVARPLPGTETRYFERLFRTPMYMQEVDNYSRGIVKDRNRLYWEDFKAMPTCYPPPIEQAAIVRYLDHVDRRVRRLVRAKRKLIGLLEEQKQAIIHRAVTRGLDPNVPLKPSGVDWLGDVPEHWEVRQLGRLGQFFKGSGGTKVDEVADGVPCVRYGDLYMMHQFFVIESRTCVTEEKATEYTPIQHGDVLFAGSGETIEEIGKSAVTLISGPACCGGDVIIFRPSIEIDASFLGYATDCPQAAYQKACMGRGITVMHIYGDESKYMFVCLPTLPEQSAIVEYLDRATEDINTAVSRADREIEFLREYRTRLIADVVTGKLDVREAAANLPEESDESEPLDETDDLPNGDEVMADDFGAIPEEAEA